MLRLVLSGYNVYERAPPECASLVIGLGMRLAGSHPNLFEQSALVREKTLLLPS